MPFHSFYTKIKNNNLTNNVKAQVARKVNNSCNNEATS